MTRRLASFFVLLAMLAGGAYAIPQQRTAHGVRVEVSAAYQRAAEIRIELRRQQAAADEDPISQPAESRHTPERPAHSLYQRPPPAAR